MRWIIGYRGEAVNLDNVTEIAVCIDSDSSAHGVYNVRAFFPGAGETADWCVLFKGSKEECHTKLAILVERLEAARV